eukprot:2914366-Pyramimonas_sp.AAC.1
MGFRVLRCQGFEVSGFWGVRVSGYYIGLQTSPPTYTSNSSTAEHEPNWTEKIPRSLALADQSDAGRAGIFSRWTNRTQDVQVYSHDG